MRVWQMSSLVSTSAWLGLWMFTACSSSDAAPDGGLVAGDAALDTAIVAVSEGGTCDDCGAPRFTAECTAAETACLGDVGCAAIRNCVFSGINGSMPCALDATGPACVDNCIQQTCMGATSVSLYRSLDQCAYCSTCATSCTAYCSSFTDAGTACPR